MKLLSKPLLLALLLLIGFSSFLPPIPARAENDVVRAVLFYSPSCPHCHLVIQETLPPLLDQYGEQLEIVGVDITTEGGSALFGSAIQRFAIPPDEQGVPMLIIGETILVGSVEIPDRFPDLIETGLAQGGFDWPDIPGLREGLAGERTEATAAPSPAVTASPSTPQALETVTTQVAARPSPTALVSALILPDDSRPSLYARLAQDLFGNTIAIIVIIGMLFSFAGSAVFIRRVESLALFIRPSYWILVLCLAGLFVAGYLAYVETARVEAVCGPVGDCNVVQQSEYARLFGHLPIGVLGLAGYGFILIAWLAGRFGSDRIARLGSLALLGMTLFGVLFSIYLTFLEPFVIGATCAWCLSSAVIMTLLLWLSVVPGKHALLSFHQTRSLNR